MPYAMLPQCYCRSAGGASVTTHRGRGAVRVDSAPVLNAYMRLCWTLQFVHFAIDRNSALCYTIHSDIGR